MGKSIWRLNYISKSVVSRIIKNQLNNKINITDILILKKSSIIPNQFDRVTTLIYKGSRFRVFKIYKFSMGWKFGEFVITRKPNIFIKKVKNKNSKNIRR
jgi:ribosomal protein S19